MTKSSRETERKTCLPFFLSFLLFLFLCLFKSMGVWEEIPKECVGGEREKRREGGKEGQLLVLIIWMIKLVTWVVIFYFILIFSFFIFFYFFLLVPATNSVPKPENPPNLDRSERSGMMNSSIDSSQINAAHISSSDLGYHV